MCILPTFQLVLLRVNDTMLWGTSIYSYVKAYQHVLLLIAYIAHAFWLSDLQCSQVYVARTSSTSELLVCGDPAVRYIVAIVTIEREFSGAVRMQIASN